MSLYVERKYLMLLSPKLERFTQKKDNLWNCRCPLCGDSKKNKLKARGYFYPKGNILFYTCHNCGISSSLKNILKNIDQHLYNQYNLELYPKEFYQSIITPPEPPKKVFTKAISLLAISELPKDHFAVKFISDRKIPKEHWGRLFFTENFGEFVKETFPEHEEIKLSDPRIVLPFYNEENVIQGVQGRAILASKIRYITIKASKDSKKVFGLERIDFKKPIYVCEGPIDSLFLQNSVATMDANLESVYKTIGNYDYIFVFDNEDRSKEIVKLMNKCVLHDRKLCIWPKEVSEKDVNDMVKAGRDVEKIIGNNTFSGLRAKLEFEGWRKI